MSASVSTVDSQPNPLPAPSSLRVRMRKPMDTAFYLICVAGAASMVLLLALLAIVLINGAMPAMQRFGFKFLVDSDWNPSADPTVMNYGALPFVYGTLVSSVIALLIALPVSIGAALFLTRLAPQWLVGPVAFLIELLAAIPSIVFGFWGVSVLVDYMQRYVQPALGTLHNVPVLGELFKGSTSIGLNMLTASVVLAIMIVPIITAVTRDVLLSVPREIEEGAYALGATWWQASKAVLNFGKVGILGAVILGLARAIGETMAVTMVIGNNNNISYSLFQGSQTMASLLANEFREADNPMYTSALVYVSLVLLIVTLVLNGIARWLVTRVKQGMGSGTVPKRTAVPLPKGTMIMHKQHKHHAATSDKPKIKLKHYSKIVRIKNHIFRWLCIASAVLAIASLASIFGFVLIKGVSNLSLDFFTQVPGPSGARIGMKNAILGTLELMAMASVIGIPMGMLCGIYLSEYAKPGKFSDGLRMVVDVLAGTPSIIIGVLAYEMIVKPMHGYSGIAGAVALAFLMCPIIARTTEEMMRLVPERYREASLALGSARFHSILLVVLPAARSGIVTGIMLSVARVAGETAPLLFTCVGWDSVEFDPRKQFPALTLQIFKYATSAEEAWINQAWAGMLVLITIIAVLSALMRLASRDTSGAARGA